MNTEKFPVEKVVNALKSAFGGASQLPDHVVGMALAGQVNNNWYELGASELDAVVSELCDNEDMCHEDLLMCREEVLRGMRLAVDGWPDDNPAVMALRALEQSAH